MVNESARLLGAPVILRLARALPGMNTAAVAAAVRDRLLMRPRALAEYLERLPHLLGLQERLADEPRRRLHVAVTMQQEAVAAAAGHCGAGAALERCLDGRWPQRLRMLELLWQGYETQIRSALENYFAPVLPQGPTSSAKAPPPRLNAVGILEAILSARLVRGALLPAPSGKSVASRDRLLSVRSIQGARQLAVAGFAESLTFENLPVTAGQVIWDRCIGELPELPRGIVLTLAAIDAIASTPALSTWTEPCCRYWPLSKGGQDHAQAVLLSQHAAHKLCAPGREAETLAALDALAEPLTRRLLHAAWSRPERSRRLDCNQIIAHVSLVCRAVAAGLSQAELASLFADEQEGALELVLAHASDRAARFVTMLRAWTTRRAEGATRIGTRRERLATWDLAGHAARQWAVWFILLDAELLESILELLTSLALTNCECVDVMRQLADFAQGPTHSIDELGKAPMMEQVRRRAALVAASLEPLARHLRSIPPEQPGRVTGLLAALPRVLAVAEGAAQTGWPQPVDLLASCLAAVNRKSRTGGDAAAPAFFRSYEGESLASLVALARGHLDRLLALGALVTELDYTEVRQLTDAWAYLRQFDSLADAVSRCAARQGMTARGLRLLVRMGLCLRLRRHDQLRAALEELAAIDAAPADDQNPLAFARLRAGHQAMLSKLLRLRPDGELPNAINDVLRRHGSILKEFTALECRATLSPSAARRGEHLLRMLSEPARLDDWIARDLDKLLPAALDEACLQRLEQIAESAIAAHFTRLLGGPPPRPADECQQRNWDNALRLYFSIDANRALLRRLLMHEARGDRSWMRRQSVNARFLREIAEIGIDVDAWLAPFRGTVDSPIGPLRIEVETDPLHVLQMGNYFDTCLSEGQFNAFSTIANAIEVNKRVLYAYDAAGSVVGRKLLAMTRQGTIIGFRTYGRARERPDQAGGEANEQPGNALKAAFDDFCYELARRCGARLHRHPSEPLPEGKAGRDPLALFAKWYNDGAEAFEPRASASTAQPERARSRRHGGQALA